jgi:hypothetical protein
MSSLIRLFTKSLQALTERSASPDFQKSAAMIKLLRNSKQRLALSETQSGKSPLW